MHTVYICSESQVAGDLYMYVSHRRVGGLGTTFHEQKLIPEDRKGAA